MSTERNKQLVRRWLEEFNDEVVDAIFAPRYRHHDPVLPAEMQRSSTAYKEVINMFRVGFADFKIVVEDLFAEGDRVAARWNFSGTTITGKAFETSAISISRIEGNKIAETWVNADFFTMFRQLDMLNRISKEQPPA
jgi:predicted ester cyclase